MTSQVFFAGLRARKGSQNKISKLERLFNKAGFKNVFSRGDLCALKVHVGERGCDTFINPIFIRALVDKLKALGAKPFLTDSNTLYLGQRRNAVDHLTIALEHGFAYATVGAPMLIACGLRGKDAREVEIARKHFRNVKIAGAIRDADSMLVISHFKGHALAGFGGAIKNLAMGCAAPAGKREQHSPRFFIRSKNCVGCGRCLRLCPAGAITLGEEPGPGNAKKKASIDKEICIGCGECLTACLNNAVGMDNDKEIIPFTERMVEYALGAVQGKKDKLGFFNFLLNITPDCDCCVFSDSPIVPDIGILASSDPVALDKASLDLVNRQAGLENSLLKTNLEPNQDKFKGVWDYTAGEVQISYAEEIGLGSSRYEIIQV